MTQTVLRHSGQSTSLQCFPSSLESIDACLHSASVDSDEILILEFEILELDFEGDAHPFDFDFGYWLLRRIQGKWVPIRAKHIYQDAVVLPFSAIRAAIALYVSNLPSNVTKTWFFIPAEETVSTIFSIEQDTYGITIYAASSLERQIEDELQSVGYRRR